MSFPTPKPPVVARYLHVGINWANVPKVAELEAKLSKALDWVRYAPNCWILYTTNNANEWSRRIRPLLPKGGHVLIVKLDRSEKQGWLPSSVWEWLNKKR